jgi:hypothetical protein
MTPEDRLARIVAEQNRLLAEQARNQERITRVAASQSDVLIKSLIDMINGGIGGKAGLGFETPSFAGGLSRY